MWRQCHLAGRTIAIAVGQVINHFDVFTLQSLISLDLTLSEGGGGGVTKEEEEKHFGEENSL